MQGRKKWILIAACILIVSCIGLTFFMVMVKKVMLSNSKMAPFIMERLKKANSFPVNYALKMVIPIRGPLKTDILKDAEYIAHMKAGLLKGSFTTELLKAKVSC